MVVIQLLGMTDTKYTVWDYGKQKIIEYERHGECNQCGDCCAVRIYIQAGGSDNTAAVINGKDRCDYGIHHPHPKTELCEKFQSNACLMHNDKPTQCLHWPWAPDCLTYFSRCSYIFEETHSWDMGEDKDE